MFGSRRARYADLTVGSRDDFMALELSSDQDLTIAHQHLEECWHDMYRLNQQVAQPPARLRASPPRQEVLSAIHALTPSRHQTHSPQPTSSPQHHPASLQHVPPELLMFETKHLGSADAWEEESDPWGAPVRMGSDRQMQRPVELQCSEWSHLAPQLCVTGKQLVPDHDTGVQFYPPVPHPASSAQTQPSCLSGQGDLPTLDGLDQLEVVGRAVPLKPASLPEATAGSSVQDSEVCEEVYAAEGDMQEVLAVQHDAWESDLLHWAQPAPLSPAAQTLQEQEQAQTGAEPQLADVSEWPGLAGADERDVRAMRCGLPPVQPELSVVYQLVDKMMDQWWRGIAPALAPLVSRRIKAIAAEGRAAAAVAEAQEEEEQEEAGVSLAGDDDEQQQQEEPEEQEEQEEELEEEEASVQGAVQEAVQEQEEEEVIQEAHWQEEASEPQEQQASGSPEESSQAGGGGDGSAVKRVALDWRNLLLEAPPHQALKQGVLTPQGYHETPGLGTGALPAGLPSASSASHSSGHHHRHNPFKQQQARRPGRPAGDRLHPSGSQAGPQARHGAGGAGGGGGGGSWSGSSAGLLGLPGLETIPLCKPVRSASMPSAYHLEVGGAGSRPAGSTPHKVILSPIQHPAAQPAAADNSGAATRGSAPESSNPYQQTFLAQAQMLAAASTSVAHRPVLAPFHCPQGGSGAAAHSGPLRPAGGAVLGGALSHPAAGSPARSKAYPPAKPHTLPSLKPSPAAALTALSSALNLGQGSSGGGSKAQGHSHGGGVSPSRGLQPFTGAGNADLKRGAGRLS